jgi:hypothetical protein
VVVVGATVVVGAALVDVGSALVGGALLAGAASSLLLQAPNSIATPHTVASTGRIPPPRLART